MFFLTLMMIPCSSGVDASTCQPCLLEDRKTNICQICGDKGDLKRLIYCVQCQVSTEHSYCIAKFHKEDDGTTSWKCDDCSLKDAKCGLKQSRKSERISQSIEAKYNRMKIKLESIPLRKQKSVVLEQAYMGKISEAECSNPLEGDDIDNKNQDLPIKKRRRLYLKDEDDNYEDSESHESPSNAIPDQPTLDSENYGHTKTTDESESTMLQGLLYPGFDRYSLAEPVSDPAWRGQFRMNNTALLGLVAHLSSMACSEVHCAVTGLPTLLDVELLSRFDIWPRSFQMSPPADDNIGLYIFPQYESDERVFDSVMNDLIEQDLALKAIITNNVELLIFSSRVLPPESWRIRRKYYLWGVFRQKGRREDSLSN